MTNREKNRQRRQYDCYQAAAEKRWFEPVHAALQKQIRSFVDFMKDQGVQMALPQIDVIITPEPVRQVITRLYNQEGVKYANIRYGYFRDTYGKELEQQKDFGLNADWLRGIRDFLFQYGARKITRVTETTRKHVRQYIEQAVEEGQSIDEISQGLLNSEITISRSRLISRTETNTALNYANEMAISKTGIMFEDTWLSSHDSRVRHSHRLVDGEVITHGGRFSNGLRYPGDPEGDADEVINCRCTKIQEAKRDGAGRIIRVPIMQ